MMFLNQEIYHQVSEHTIGTCGFSFEFRMVNLVTAFLYNLMDKTVFMEISEGMELDGKFNYLRLI